MAEEDEERELTEEEIAEEQRKAKRKQRFLLIGMGVLLVLLSVAMTLTLLYFLGSDEAEGELAEDEVVEEPLEPAKQVAIYYPIRDKFVINYNVRGRQRFLQAEVNLMFRDNDVAGAIEQHLPRIRNDLIMLFSGQEFEDLQLAEGRELLRQDALRRVQQILEQEMGKPGVEQVLFTSFVMQ